MAKANDFKFGTQLGFAKAHQKITPIRKCGCCLRLGKRPKILGFPYNICATLTLTHSVNNKWCDSQSVDAVDKREQNEQNVLTRNPVTTPCLK